MKVTGKMVKCPKCGKEMIDKGLGGHLYGVHMIRVGDKAELATLRDYKLTSEKRIAELESKSRQGVASLQDSVSHAEAEAKALRDKMAKARRILNGTLNGYKYHDERDLEQVNKALQALS